MTTIQGFLAIWSDIPKLHETNYLHWFTREHAAERVGLPGFIRVRFFRARLPEVRRYFILYDLQSSNTIASESYLERLNDPTQWSRQIMPLLENFTRGGGRRIARRGLGDGAVVAPLSFGTHGDAPSDVMLHDLSALDRIASATYFEVDQRVSAVPSYEKSLRTEDRSFDGLLLVEALDDPALDTALDKLRKRVSITGPIARYEHVFALDRANLKAAV